MTNPDTTTATLGSGSAAPLGKSGRPIVNWHKAQQDHRTRGERAADMLRNGMGSWPFVFSFLAFMAVWALVNSLPIKWDGYPFILLNLFLSMLAGLQGAILLIAAKRQDALSAALAQHDYDTNVAAKRDIEELIAINKTQLDIIQELRAMQAAQAKP
jgi:uncharacterized membrane protein